MEYLPRPAGLLLHADRPIDPSDGPPVSTTIGTALTEPIELDVRGAGQIMDVTSLPEGIAIDPRQPVALAAHWHGLTVPLCIRGLYVNARHVLQIELQRPALSQQGLSTWANLHGTPIPPWLSTTVHLFDQTQPVWVGVFLLLMAYHYRATIVALAVSSAWRIVQALRQEGPTPEPRNTLPWLPFLLGRPFTQSLDCGDGIATLKQLDANAHDHARNAANAVDWLKRLVDFKTSKLTLEYNCPEGAEHSDSAFFASSVLIYARPLDGHDLEIGGSFLLQTAAVGGRPQSMPDAATLGVRVGLRGHLGHTSRSHRANGVDDDQTFCPADTSPVASTSPLSPISPDCSGANIAQQLPAAIESLIRGLEESIVFGSVDLARTNMPIKDLWPSVRGALGISSLRLSEKATVGVNTKKGPGNLTEIHIRPRGDSITLQLGISQLMSALLPRFAAKVFQVTQSHWFRGLSRKALPPLSLSAELQAIVLRPSALLMDHASRPWLEVVFCLGQLPVLPVKKLLKRASIQHTLTISGPLQSTHGRITMTATLNSENSSDIISSDMDIPWSDSATQLGDVVSTTESVIGYLLSVVRGLSTPQDRASLDLSNLAIPNGLQIKLDRSGTSDTLKATSTSPQATIEARLDVNRT